MIVPYEPLCWEMSVMGEAMYVWGQGVYRKSLGPLFYLAVILKLF